MKNFKFVISWSSADGEDSACYTVALYGDDSGTPLQFYTVEDDGGLTTTFDACMPMIAALRKEFKAPRSTPFEWDI